MSERPSATSTDVVIDDRPDHRVLMIDRSERRNALAVCTVDALRAELDQAGRDEVPAVVITGRPPAFCSGGDLPSLSAAAAGGAIVASDMVYGSFHGLVRAIRDCPVPVIAAVNGAAMGAGLDLALCCDLRIAAPGALFESTWIKVGLVPGMGAAFHLPHVVGSTRAADLLLRGRRLTAAEALEWGLVNEVADDVLAAAAETAARIAALPAVAVVRTKAALRRSRDRGLDDELATLGAVQGQLLTGADFQAVAAAMGSQRPARASVRNDPA
jgi:2-(1,2-epoxy-1,2-dihydrophenyl)acetyl-CoA isomerase